MPGNDCNGEEKARTWRQDNITTKTMCERTGRAMSTIMKVLAASSELDPMLFMEVECQRRPRMLKMVC